MTSTQMQAHAAVSQAVRKGLLARRACEECGVTPAVAHHDDYSRPLDVRWLCQQHHRQWHSKHGEAPGNVGDRQVSTTIEKADYTQFETIANDLDVSLAWLLRKVIRDYLAAKATA